MKVTHHSVQLQIISSKDTLERERERERRRVREREREREKESKRERKREGEGERESESEKERERESKRERCRENLSFPNSTNTLSQLPLPSSYFLFITWMMVRLDFLPPHSTSIADTDSESSC